MSVVDLFLDLLILILRAVAGVTATLDAILGKCGDRNCSGFYVRKRELHVIISKDINYPQTSKFKIFSFRW